MPATLRYLDHGMMAPRHLPVKTEGGPSDLDRTAADLVESIARAGWDIDEIDVELMVISNNSRLFVLPSSIRGTDDSGPFQFSFSSSYGPDGPVAAILTSATVAGYQINWHSDHSGPRAYLYVGDDWHRDGLAFTKALKVNSRLDREPRTYLTYVSWNGSPHLALDTDLGRQYGAENDEPTFLVHTDLRALVRTHLEAVTARVARLPAAPGHDEIDAFGDTNLRRITAVTPVPAGEDFPKIYAWIEPSHIASLSLQPGVGEDLRRGFDANGWRLSTFSTPQGPEPLPEDAFRGFTYASTSPDYRAASPGRQVGSNELPVEITLEHLNDVFVFDGDAHEWTRQRIDATDTGQPEYTRAENIELHTAAARTMMPAEAYDGRYANPVYAINRFLPEHEVRLIAGPVSIDDVEKGYRLSVVDEASGREIELLSTPSRTDYCASWAWRAARDAAYHMNVEAPDRPQISAPTPFSLTR